MHSAFFVSQSFSFSLQGFTAVAHEAPDQPDVHVHVYLPGASVHVPPFMHGEDAQSLISISQL